MRQKFIDVVTDIFEQDDKSVLILGDIGVYGFAPLFAQYPDRVINIGICEQATIGVCAGMAAEGLHPIFYTIAPFAVERCFEQIKIDIGYQNLPVTIVSVGASYDYASLGCTHHCPGDVALLKTVPNMVIGVPSYTEDITDIMDQYHGCGPLYMRLPQKGCNIPLPPYHEKENVVIVFGDALENTIYACEGLNVSIMNPIILTLPMRHWWRFKKIAIIEPFYEGTMVAEYQKAFPKTEILSIGVPRKFLANYGTKLEQDKACGLDVGTLESKLKKFFYA